MAVGSRSDISVKTEEDKKLNKAHYFWFVPFRAQNQQHFIEMGKIFPNNMINEMKKEKEIKDKFFCRTRNIWILKVLHPSKYFSTHNIICTAVSQIKW